MPSTWPTSPILDPRTRVVEAEQALAEVKADAERSAAVWAERVRRAVEDLADARRAAKVPRPRKAA